MLPNMFVGMALCLRARIVSRTFSSAKHHLNLKSACSIKPHSLTSSFSISTKATSLKQIIEHFVLFRVRDSTDPSKVNAMVGGLNGLISLDQVLHIAAGPLFRIRSSSPLSFTHFLHSRYSSKEDLSAYSLHPNHVSVAKACVSPIVDDIMAVDWVAGDLNGPVAPRPGSALRVTLVKLKESVDDGAKSVIVETIKGVGNSFKTINQISAGENFSPDRSKGFSIASLAVFPGLADLVAADSNQELVNMQKDKVGDHLESVMVVDYVVPTSQSASL